MTNTPPSIGLFFSSQKAGDARKLHTPARMAYSMANKFILKGESK